MDMGGVDGDESLGGALSRGEMVGAQAIAITVLQVARGDAAVVRAHHIAEGPR